ncbi:uncharacterized protein LOC120417379 [Culex pipiens pallens]|uniref:uncharacterized protein LOC120417379 n=1 Tax=Culex pipiens pallens TaxID=42434 RepID=UPI0019546498|nr:uncharacterized protein LOC120417379 [Culex pipiens pallens]
MFKLVPFPRAEDLTIEEIEHELTVRKQPESIFLLDLPAKQRKVTTVASTPTPTLSITTPNPNLTPGETSSIASPILNSVSSGSVTPNDNLTSTPTVENLNPVLTPQEPSPNSTLKTPNVVPRIPRFEFPTPDKNDQGTVCNSGSSLPAKGNSADMASGGSGGGNGGQAGDDKFLTEWKNMRAMLGDLVDKNAELRTEIQAQKKALMAFEKQGTIKKKTSATQTDEDSRGAIPKNGKELTSTSSGFPLEEWEAMKEMMRTIMLQQSSATANNNNVPPNNNPPPGRGSGNPRQSPPPYPSSYEGDYSDPGSSRGGVRGSQRNRDRAGRFDGRIEKWKIRFSGDSNVSVESFLYKAKKLAEREEIPPWELLRNIHKLLEGTAEDWFFTYADDFDCWRTFEGKFTHRFGNPNKDQGIRSTIKYRKQQRGEAFKAFVDDIVRLNRLLTNPLPQDRLFETIWDNMRDHYKTKIAIVGVGNLDDLLDINHRIDAADSSIKQQADGSGEASNQRHVNHVEVDECGSDEDGAPVNAIRGQQNSYRPSFGSSGQDQQRPTSGYRNPYRSSQSRPQQQPGEQGLHQQQPQDQLQQQPQQLVNQARQGDATQAANPLPAGTSGTTAQLLCWNCLVHGHSWRQCNKPKANKCPHIRVNIFDTQIDALLDSGAGVSILNSLDIIDRYRLKIQPAAIRVSTADGSNYGCLGFVNLPFTFKNTTRVIPTIVVPEISRKLILGADFWEAFGIKPMIDLGQGPESVEMVEQDDDALLCFTIEPSETTPTLEDPEEDDTLDIPVYEGPTESVPDPDAIETEHILTSEQRRQLSEVIREFELTSTGKLGRTHLIEHEIVLKEGAKPRNPPMYRCSPYVQQAINAEVERFKKLDAIEECYSEWTNPLVPVPKKNGKVRVCLDSRKINKLTVKDSYPMRNMQDIFRRLGKATYFSVIDLKDAYFQIPLKEECRNLTAFRTSEGVFRFKVLPFGLMNAPFTMSRLMAKAIGSDLEPYVFVYLDDIVIAASSFDEHLRLLRLVAERLRKAGLTISLEKSRFFRKQVMYLGYLLNEHGVAIDKSRIQPILDYAQPRTQEDIRRLMGLAGFYQRFIKDYSRMTAPITDLLTKENKRFTWTKEAEDGFRELKAVLTSAPILGNPDFSKLFTIESDASDRAVGAALVQEQDGVTRVISYFSKKLNRTQRRYSAVEKECLGVLSAIQHFRHYVEGTKFRVITDARSLLWLFNVGAETGNAKLLRWALRIQAYDFDLEYRKGKANITADCLSRSIEVDAVRVTLSDDEYEEQIENITGNPTKFSDYRVIDGRIFRYVKSPNRQTDPRFSWKLLPPRAERKEIITKVHDQAHFGFEKTLASLKERHYWPKMREEVRKHCRECLQCQVSKAGNQNVTPPMGPQKPVQYPWQFITLDYVGPLPASGKNRNTCLLVVTDVFSKFVLVQPFREAKAHSLTEFVENNVFRLFGVPEIVLTDNGTQFLSKQFKTLLESYHVQHWLTPAYHPQVNNTERVNRVITTAIRATLKKDHKHWADNLQDIADAIRNAVHDSTHYSPYFVVFGRNKVSDGREYSWIRDNYEPSDDDKDVPEQKKKLFEEIKKNLTAAYQRHAKTYNLRTNANCPKYTVGEKVLKQTFDLSDKGKGFCKKLAPKYEPAVVRKVLGKNTYELEDLDGKRFGVYFTNRLKKWHTPQPAASGS